MTTSVRVIVTAGYDKARHSLSLVELLERQGHTVLGVLVTRVVSMHRARDLYRRSGKAFLRGALRRAIGFDVAPTAASNVDARTIPAPTRTSLRRWARSRGAEYLAVDNLNGKEAVTFIRRLSPDGVLYSGGGILRTDFLDAAGRRVLNAHAGPLPAIRGMNACEWALLLDEPTTVTIHGIDEGVDTGPTFARIPVPVREGDTLDALRQRAVDTGIKGLCDHVHVLTEPWPVEKHIAAALSRQCFVLAPALRELAAARVQARASK
jgi:folate-dependent phosphoribosylglycinamide formyltransferase PurN